MKPILGLVVVLVLVALAAYSRSRKVVRSSENQRQSVGVGFEELAQSADGSRRFRIGFADQDEAAPVIFDFEYQPKAVPAGQVAAMVSGTLSHHSDVPPDAFLAALAEVHGVSVAMYDLPAKRKITLDVALFGEALHLGNGKQQIAGLFTSDSIGSWMVAKLFMPFASDAPPGEEAEEHSEIFLALNLKEGYGVLYPKADEYATGVLRGFNALLKP